MTIRYAKNYFYLLKLDDLAPWYLQHSHWSCLCYRSSEEKNEKPDIFTRPLILLNNSNMYGFSITELIFISYWTSFCSQTWLLLLVCLGKCFPYNFGIFNILHDIIYAMIYYPYSIIALWWWIIYHQCVYELLLILNQWY